MTHRLLSSSMHLLKLSLCDRFQLNQLTRLWGRGDLFFIVPHTKKPHSVRSCDRSGGGAVVNYTTLHDVLWREVTAVRNAVLLANGFYISMGFAKKKGKPRKTSFNKFKLALTLHFVISWRYCFVLGKAPSGTHRIIRQESFCVDMEERNEKAQ